MGRRRDKPSYEWQSNVCGKVVEVSAAALVNNNLSLIFLFSSGLAGFQSSE